MAVLGAIQGLVVFGVGYLGIKSSHLLYLAPLENACLKKIFRHLLNADSHYLSACLFRICHMWQMSLFNVSQLHYNVITLRITPNTSGNNHYYIFHYLSLYNLNVGCEREFHIKCKNIEFFLLFIYI